jgi:hypothetical protein
MTRDQAISLMADQVRRGLALEDAWREAGHA